MEQRLLIVCTRMSAEVEGDDDEYKHVWNGSGNHFRLPISEAHDAVVVIRGCIVAHKVDNGNIDEAYRDLISSVQEAVVSFQQFEKGLVFHKGGPLPNKHWKQFFSRFTSQIVNDLNLVGIKEYGRDDQIYQSLMPIKDRWEAHLFDQIWHLIKIPHKPEAYFDVMLNLALDDKCRAKDAKKKHDSDIQKAASKSELEAWEDIKTDIKNWEVSQRDVMGSGGKTQLEILEEKFMKFAKTELIKHYPYLSDLE